MLAPIIHFDFVNKRVTTIPPGPEYDKLVAETVRCAAFSLPGRG